MYVGGFHFVAHYEGGHTFRLFENRVLRRIFGVKRDGVTEEWRKLHNEELNLLALELFF